MPLFPPVTDTLRWDDLVRQGRAQLPLVSPEWTDQNVSDPGIALLELISWLVETDSYRSSAVSDRERRLLLALAGYAPLPPRPATCLVRVIAAAGTLAPRGLAADGDRGGEFVPLVLADDIAVTGARIAAVAWANPGAEADGYRSGCHDLTREHSAGRVLLPLGPDPVPGNALLLGLAAAGGLAAGTLDLWLLPGEGTSAPETPSEEATHHAATTVWECWDGTAWTAPAEVADDTAALTRAGRVRLTLPALTEGGLGDQASGVLAGRTLVWLRCRLASGRHDAAPALTGLYTDVGTAIAAHPYPDTGAAAGTELGVALGIPGETLLLPRPWCGTPPRLWLSTPAGPEPIPLVADLAHAGPTLLAATIDPDGVTVRFGDGRWGRTLPAGATVLATGTWTTEAGVGEVRPPVTVAPPPAAAISALELVASLRPGRPGEDVAEVAARAEADLWVHDRLTEAVARRRATSLDDLPLDAVRTLGVPERAVTALDLERLALSTPGVTLWRARALPQVDPRLPGLKADGCVTVVVVPQLPVAAPEPTAGALSRVRARLAAARTVGTRFFVVGPTYVRVGVRATLVLRPGFGGEAAIADATLAVRTFLHPVTGGPAGRGWPFGRAVRRTELLQLLDGLPAVDRVEGLALSRTLTDGTTCTDCGDIALGPTQLALADTVVLTAAKGVAR